MLCVAALSPGTPIRSQAGNGDATSYRDVIGTVLLHPRIECLSAVELRDQTFTFKKAAPSGGGLLSERVACSMPCWANSLPQDMIV